MCHWWEKFGVMRLRHDYGLIPAITVWQHILQSVVSQTKKTITFCHCVNVFLSLLCRLTGFTIPPPVTSSGSIFSLRLTSDFAVSAHGFKVVYEGKFCSMLLPLSSTGHLLPKHRLIRQHIFSVLKFNQ